MKNNIKYYMNNPCEIVREISPEFSEVKVYKSFDDEISGSDWCQGCILGTGDPYYATHTCDEYNDILDQLREKKASMVVVVENRLLQNEPVEFKAWRSIKESAEKQENNRKKSLEETLNLKKQSTQLQKEIEQLIAEKSTLLSEIATLDDRSSELTSEFNDLKNKSESLSSVQIADGVTIGISVRELKRLIENDLKMGWLEKDGVDNWTFYGESFPDSDDIESLVDGCLNSYEVKVK